MSPSTEINYEVSGRRPRESSSKLKPRHLYMIATGGCIGAAFLVGTGRTLAKGGPVFCFVGFAFICSVIGIFSTILTEMAAAVPLNGAGTDYYPTRFLSKSFGFAMGYNYWFAYAILVPFEITVSTLVIHYWNPPVHDAVFLTILLVVIVGLNYLPVKDSGEAEFLFSSLKVTMLVSIMILSIIIVAGGGPTGERVGSRNWDTPIKPWILEGSVGSLLAFLGVLVSIVLPMGFIAEMVAVCGGETKNPAKTLPKAARAFVFRLAFFYVLPVFFVTLICPADAPELTSGGSGAGSSPFVIGIKTAHIRVLDHIINAIILLSAWSAGNVYCYLSSRSLYSLSIDGYAPKFFARTNKYGTPYWSVTTSGLAALLAYLNVRSSAGQVLTWLVNIINISSVFSWVLLSWSYIRFRKALEVQGVDRNRLPYRARLGKSSAWFCIFFFTVIGLLNGFQVFFPSEWNAADFITAYIGIPLFVLLFFGHKYFRGRSEPWLVPLNQLDLSPLSVIDAVSVGGEVCGQELDGDKKTSG
ncbi:hypothetical protein V3481_014078 [Fusarium oxysporum f. sp. vasinfectum]|uniref:Amino acid permease/ SLC12A domain-containing protein n=1 Tax=Fusarium oxysporum f. sp. vasinfectum 25433 TaxID=1089449 RepID=X0LY13_FUSOX|nr:hypothetical protein FOTG_07143 [Fusarium oxysporum f. sp. vasinfectum 25433]